MAHPCPFRSTLWKRSALTAVLILVLAAPALAQPLLAENFESVAIGALPSGWSVATGTGSVQNSTDDDGLATRALLLPGGTAAAVEVPGLPGDEFRLEMDIAFTGTPQGFAFVHFRGASLSDGYRVGVDVQTLLVRIQRVAGGVLQEPPLASSVIPRLAPAGDGNWYHLIVQVQGSEIRAFESKTHSDLVAIDEALSPGAGDKVFLGSGALNAAKHFDNLVVAAPTPLEAATAPLLPFNTSFEAGEFAPRNSIELPASIDAYLRGGSYVPASGDDGLATTALQLKGTHDTAMEVVGIPSDHFRLQMKVAFTGTLQGSAFVHFRGADLENGYRVGVEAENAQGRVRVEKLSGGAVTDTLGVFATQAPAVAGDGAWYDLSLEVRAGRIRVVETKGAVDEEVDDALVTEAVIPPSLGDRMLLGGDSLNATKLFDDLTIELLPLPGRKLLIKDKAGDPGKRRVVAVWKSDSLPYPVVSPLEAGATVTLYNPGSAETDTFALPAGAANWKLLKSGGFKYADRKRRNGPCTRVSLLPGKRISVVCGGDGITYTLDEPESGGGQGAVAARLSISATDYCTEFGGEIKKDKAVSDRASGVGVFKARNAAGASSCPVPRAASSTTTTTTTTSSTSTSTI